VSDAGAPTASGQRIAEQCKLEQRQVAKLLDHALLKPTLTEAELWQGCEFARAHEVASVCIVPFAVRRCAELLRGSGVQPSTTVGFPHGAGTWQSKEREARESLEHGATELDMVVNINRVLSGNFAAVRQEIEAVLSVVRGANARLKVIFENCYLERQHKLELCEICSELSVDWVKTSTGFGSGGATILDVELMRAHTLPEIGVKASGGIRTLAEVLAFEALGCSRVGTTATASIMKELAERP
jgi:deoxyribose-phosphate aldolase